MALDIRSRASRKKTEPQAQAYAAADPGRSRAARIGSAVLIAMAALVQAFVLRKASAGTEPPAESEILTVQDQPLPAVPAAEMPTDDPAAAPETPATADEVLPALAPPAGTGQPLTHAEQMRGPGGEPVSANLPVVPAQLPLARADMVPQQPAKGGTPAAQADAPAGPASPADPAEPSPEEVQPYGLDSLLGDLALIVAPQSDAAQQAFLGLAVDDWLSAARLDGLRRGPETFEGAPDWTVYAQDRQQAAALETPTARDAYLARFLPGGVDATSSDPLSDTPEAPDAFVPDPA